MTTVLSNRLDLSMRTSKVIVCLREINGLQKRCEEFMVDESLQEFCATPRVFFFAIKAPKTKRLKERFCLVMQS